MHPDECPHWDYEDPNPDCDCAMRERVANALDEYPDFPDYGEGDNALDDQEEP